MFLIRYFKPEFSDQIGKSLSKGTSKSDLLFASSSTQDNLKHKVKVNEPWHLALTLQLYPHLGTAVFPIFLSLYFSTLFLSLSLSLSPYPLNNYQITKIELYCLIEKQVVARSSQIKITSLQLLKVKTNLLLGIATLFNY